MDMLELKTLLSDLTDEQTQELRIQMIDESCDLATTEIRRTLQASLLSLTMRYPERFFYYNGRVVEHEPIESKE